MDAREPLADDAGRIALQVESLDAGLALQWLPALHGSLESFTRSGPLELQAMVGADDVNVHALKALQSADQRATEWLRVDLLLAARSYTAVAPSISGERCAQVEALLSGVAPSECPKSVALVHALGARGRVLEDAIYVGAPTAWSGVTPAMSAVIALHEHAVRESSGDFVRREWAALRRVACTLEEGHEVLHRAHAEWLAMADLTSLAMGAVKLDLVHVDAAHALLKATDSSCAFANLSRA